MNLKLHKPSLPISGVISLPGSKSISNRVLIIKALSGLVLDIKNCSNSDDTNQLINALSEINNQTSKIIDIGYAGTDMRFLTALLCLQNEEEFELTGSEKMQQRPIKELVDALQALGADITYKKNEGYPPLIIKGKKINGGKVKINGNVSSQFISALLLVAPYFKNGLELVIEKNCVSKPYIEMTVAIMQEFGADVTVNQNTITVKPVVYTYNKSYFFIESDWSAASYYFSLIALSPINTKVYLKSLNKNSLQPDSACVSIYKAFGVDSIIDETGVTITKIKLLIDEPINIDFINCPDIAQTVIGTCVGLKTSFEAKGLDTLTIKETNRILALKNELIKFGCDASITLNTITYQFTKTETQDATIYIATYNDHRMAMAFAPLSLIYDNVIIEDAEVVSKSYPQFWNDLKKTGFLLKSL